MQLEEGNVDKECRGEQSDQHHQHHSHQQSTGQHQTGGQQHQQLQPPALSDTIKNTTTNNQDSNMTAHGKMAAAAAQGANTGPQTQQGKHKTCTYTNIYYIDNFRIFYHILHV